MGHAQFMVLTTTHQLSLQMCFLKRISLLNTITIFFCKHVKTTTHLDISTAAFHFMKAFKLNLLIMTEETSVLLRMGSVC